MISCCILAYYVMSYTSRHVLFHHKILYYIMNCKYFSTVLHLAYHIHSFIHSSINPHFSRAKSFFSQKYFAYDYLIISFLFKHFSLWIFFIFNFHFFFLETFSDHTHLIIDEVHERSVDGDLLCLLARRWEHYVMWYDGMWCDL